MTKPGRGETTHSLYNDSGTCLALRYIPSGLKLIAPVLLTHGTFSNHRSCRGLARHLAARGFDCWMLDFQGHGDSAQPSIEPSFESMCVEDVKAAFQYLRSRYDEQRVVVIGHSGGGLAILMYLARYPDEQKHVRSLVTIASQATSAANVSANRILIILSKFITTILGWAPGKVFRVGPENEFSDVMKQWFDWNLSGTWKGVDEFDYVASLKLMEVPCLMLAAEADRLIAPYEGCKYLYDQYGGSSKLFHICGLSTQFTENYTHSRIIHSSSASREIWPLISSWLLNNDTTQGTV